MEVGRIEICGGIIAGLGVGEKGGGGKMIGKIVREREQDIRLREFSSIVKKFYF